MADFNYRLGDASSNQLSREISAKTIILTTYLSMEMLSIRFSSVDDIVGEKKSYSLTMIVIDRSGRVEAFW
jgi:hypothetical protein